MKLPQMAQLQHSKHQLTIVRRKQQMMLIGNQPKAREAGDIHHQLGLQPRKEKKANIGLKF